MASLSLIPAAVTIAAEVFPSLVGKIAGRRAGDVAGTVIDTAAGVVGLPASADPGEILERLRSDDAAKEKLRYKFELLNAEEHERTLDDIQDARRFQLDSGPASRRRGNILLAGVGAGLIACVVIVGFTEVSPGEMALVTTIAGALLKMLSDVFAFEFGSSRGSKEKDEQINEFKQALLRVGEERGNDAKQIILSQQERLGAAEQALINRPAPAAPDAAAERPQSRDFVAQLVKGEV